MIDQEPSLVNAENNIGTPLHIASFCNRVELAKKFLELNADVNAINKYHDTALHLAARTGHDAMVALLCDRGANPFVRNQRKRDPIQVAYLKMDRSPRNIDWSLTVPQRQALYGKILRTMYQVVGKFGGSIKWGK